MTSLLDIAPITKEVTLSNGHLLTVKGVNGRSIVTLLARFPELRVLITGKMPSEEEILTRAPDAISAIIAAGLGHLNDTKSEQVIDELSIGDQADLFSAILELTMPAGGFVPFVERLTRMLGVSPGSKVFGVGEDSGKAVDTKSRGKSNS